MCHTDSWPQQLCSRTMIMETPEGVLGSPENGDLSRVIHSQSLKWRTGRLDNRGLCYLFSERTPRSLCDSTIKALVRTNEYHNWRNQKRGVLWRAGQNFECRLLVSHKWLPILNSWYYCYLPFSQLSISLNWKVFYPNSWYITQPPCFRRSVIPIRIQVQNCDLELFNGI